MANFISGHFRHERVCAKKYTSHDRSNQRVNIATKFNERLIKTKTSLQLIKGTVRSDLRVTLSAISSDDKLFSSKKKTLDREDLCKDGGTIDDNVEEMGWVGW